MGALTHNGEVMQGLPADASQINFDKTGTDLNSTQTENAIKEVNTKVNTNTADITQLKSGLTNINEGVITPETGVTLTSYALKKSINTVSISALVLLTPTLGSNNAVGVIPSEYRPSDRVYITCINSTSDKLVIGFVDKYGGIYIYPTSNDSSAVAQNYNINGVFVVG